MSFWPPAGLNNVAATLDWMRERHIHVTLMGPTGLYDFPLPRLVIIAMRSSSPSILHRHLDGSKTVLDAQMSQLAMAHHADYISLLSLEGLSYPCSLDQGYSWPEISDQEHFNLIGSKIIAAKVRDAYPSFGR
jgi:hypothetical protein